MLKRAGFKVGMQLGVDVAQQRMDFDELVRRVHFAEELGCVGAWGFDHFVPMYGHGPGNCFEGMTTLAALSGATSRIRLGLLVAGVTYRHPSVFAAQAVTIDHASHGRLDIGLGAGWYEAEHRRLGIEFPHTRERFDLLEDQLEILHRLSTGDVVSYEGRRVSLEAARLRPMPVQRPHPPIWIGGSGRRRTLPLVAKYANAWHTHFRSGYGDLSRELDRLVVAAGRQPGSILRASTLSLSEPWDHVRRSAEAMRAAGITYLICSWPTEGQRRLEEFWTKVAPDLIDGTP
jgi:alkanesulfonate monooxygenase SsuD/methylene tetrahydromethanopterin reductase-like flavin-dependent oxidoreductase (luciferase family)